MKRLIAFYVLLWISLSASAQLNVEDLHLLEASAETPAEQQVTFLNTKGKSVFAKPVIWVSGSLLYLYQSQLTHQLPSQCPYAPSCSHFAKEAISHHGFLKGVFLAADRLMRCLPDAENDVPHFKVDFVTRRISDSPADY